MSEETLHLLKKYWGYEFFKPLQDEIISSILNNNDTIILLPTGGGKSLCFQLPAFQKDGVCIVISPLVALMQDQINGLTEKNIKATTIPAGLKQDDIITLFDNIRFGNYKFLYLSPERLQSKLIQNKIKQLNVNFIAIDEAHCISEWGHDFRPSYLNIKILKPLLPNTPIIALTATATQKVLDDIAKSLDLKNPKIFKKSSLRKNIAYRILKVNDKLGRLERIIRKINAPIIIYVSTRKKTKDISNYLNAIGFKATYYNGGLTSKQKQTSFRDWFSEKKAIMVATNAFGMGIDKSNVRAVIHLDLPSSIENYTQEAGRAGRDLKKAYSITLVNENDLLSFKERYINNTPTINEIKVVHSKLYQHFQIAKGELISSCFNFNLTEFCEKYHFSIKKTTLILQLLNSNGIIELNKSIQKKSTLQFLISSKQLIKIGKSKIYGSLIQLILRLYGGVFEQQIQIDEFYIAKKLNITSFTVIELLEKLMKEGILSYHKVDKDLDLYFLQPREDDLSVNRISKNINSFFNQKIKKAQYILNFTQNRSICRAMVLLNYFNEKGEKCGICDICLRNQKTKKTDLIKNILELFSDSKKELFSHEICKLLNDDENEILMQLRKLIANDVIGVTPYNKYFLK